MIIQGNNPYVDPSFGFKNKAMRFIWWLFNLILFRFSPRPCHVWRKYLLIIFGAKIGRHVHIYPKVQIWAPWNLKIGDYVGIGNGANIYNMDYVEIDKYSVISQGSHICCGSHNYNSRNFQLVTKPVKIGKHVWVCAEAFVGPGVTINDGVVLGARAVAKKDLDAWCVYDGNPCHKMGLRKMESSNEN